MARGTARRVAIADKQELASVIASLQSHETLTLGSRRADLPDREIVTKHHLDELDDAARPDIIARTCGYIVFPPRQQALALLDFDRKGMPPHVATKFPEFGDFWTAIVSICPVFGERRATDASLDERPVIPNRHARRITWLQWNACVRRRGRWG